MCVYVCVCLSELEQIDREVCICIFVCRDYREKRKVLLNHEHRIMLKMAPDYEHLPLINKVDYELLPLINKVDYEHLPLISKVNHERPLLINKVDHEHLPLINKVGILESTFH